MSRVRVSLSGESPASELRLGKLLAELSNLGTSSIVSLSGSEASLAQALSAVAGGDHPSPVVNLGNRELTLDSAIASLQGGAESSAIVSLSFRGQKE